MQQLEVTEKTFYEDQQATRKCRLSEEIDEEYETGKELNRNKQAKEAEIDELEDLFINDTSFNENITQYKRTSRNKELLNFTGVFRCLWIAVLTNFR